MKLQTILLFLLCINYMACNNDDPITPNNTTPQEQLPPITTIGAGTFGCKVNGKVWVAKSNKTGWSPIYSSVDNSKSDFVHIIGMILLNNSTDEDIHLYFNKTERSYYPLFLINSGSRSAFFNNGNLNQRWTTDSLIGGELTVLKFDTSQQIVSGTFFFDCVNQETDDTLHITDGRFDMHYTY